MGKEKIGKGVVGKEAGKIEMSGEANEDGDRGNG
jgi:hypothetical protein